MLHVMHYILRNYKTRKLDSPIFRFFLDEVRVIMSATRPITTVFYQPLCPDYSALVQPQFILSALEKLIHNQFISGL